MIEHQGRRLELGWTCAAPVERLWAAWTDPHHLTGWFVDRASGTLTPGATITWEWHWESIKAANSVLAVEPLKQLALGFGNQVLELKFIGRQGGRTGLKLINSGLPENEEGFQAIRSGWLCSLSLLKQYLEAYWGRRKQQIMVQRETEVDFAKLIELYRPPQREVWLPGTPPVLQDTGTEVVLDWEEMQGTLELKAFPFGGKRFFALRATSWSENSLEPSRDSLNEALDRLQPLLS